MAETFAFARAYGIPAKMMNDLLMNGMFKGSPVYTATASGWSTRRSSPPASVLSWR
jgi:3-hydroxyisobutyrate dehydrogenase-like beta-hydroxyacid dehydrogenase